MPGFPPLSAWRTGAENAVKNGTNQVLIYSTIKEKDERVEDYGGIV